MQANSDRPAEQSVAENGREVSDSSPHRRQAGPPPLPPLSLKVRVALIAVGVFLLLVGVAGLALPGLQGILTLAAGLAVLSIASERVYRWLYRLLHPWPGFRERMIALRERMHNKLHRKSDSQDPDSD
jgi:hypothetical protein